MCAAKGLVVEVGGRVVYDDRSSAQKTSDAKLLSAGIGTTKPSETTRKEVDDMSKKLQSVESLEGLFGEVDGDLAAQLAEVEALITKEKLMSMGISVGSGLAQGALYSYAMTAIPDLPGNWNVLKAFIPLGVGMVGGALLSEGDMLPIGTAFLGAGAAVTGVLLGGEYLTKLGYFTFRKEGNEGGKPVEGLASIAARLGLLGGDEIEPVRQLEGDVVERVQQFEGMGGDEIMPVPEFAYYGDDLGF
jgi:hypothetical protein